MNPRPNVFAMAAPNYSANSGTAISMTALAYPMLMAGAGMGRPSPLKKKKNGMQTAGGPMGQNVFAAPPRAGGF